MTRGHMHARGAAVASGIALSARCTAPPPDARHCLPQRPRPECSNSRVSQGMQQAMALNDLQVRFSELQQLFNAQMHKNNELQQENQRLRLWVVRLTPAAQREWTWTASLECSLPPFPSSVRIRSRPHLPPP